MKWSNWLFAILTTTILAATACQKDEDEPAPRFKATITNGTAQTYDVYYKIDFATGPFEKAGMLGAGQSLEITQLNVYLTYKVRIVLPNAPADPPVQEKTVNSMGMDVGITFN